MDTNSELEQLLKQVATQNPPPLPGHFSQTIWRQIRQQSDHRPTVEVTFFNWWANLVCKPQTIAVALSLALLLGTWTGFSLNHPFPTQSGHAVQLEAFSPHAPGMLTLSIH